MNYNFPEIKNIQDVLPHLEGYNEFIVADKGSYIVINYAVDTGKTFEIDSSNPLSGYIRRECRGLKFDKKTGNIIARPFHKFANLNQWEETNISNLDFSEIKYIAEKNDGSMIHPMIIENDLFFSTKMGVTDTVLKMIEIENVVTENVKQFSIDMLNSGFTPIFEYVGPENKIVLEYKTSKLILSAVRHTISGYYVDIQNPNFNSNGIEIVKVYDQYMSMEDIVKSITNAKDIEGVVCIYSDWHMFKLKSDEYVAIHKAKEKILTDRLIIKMMFEGTIDDVMSKLDEKDREHVDSVINNYTKKYKEKEQKLNSFCEKLCRVVEGDAKAIAMLYVPKLKDKKISKFLFDYNKNGKNSEGFKNYSLGFLSQNVKYEEYMEWLDLPVE